MGHMSFILNIKVEDQDQPIVDADDAESFAYTWLENEGFCENSHFATGKADWFYVGGRFKSLLGGEKAVRYNGQKGVLKMCCEHSDRDEYIDTCFEENVNLDEGDWICVIDYHL